MTELTLKQSCSVRYKPIQKATPEREGYENAVLTHPVGVSTFLDTKAYTFFR